VVLVNRYQRNDQRTPRVGLSSYATKSDLITARTLGVIGLIAGVPALVAGGIAVGRGRRAAVPQRQFTPTDQHQCPVPVANLELSSSQPEETAGVPDLFLTTTASLSKVPPRSEGRIRPTARFLTRLADRLIPTGRAHVADQSSLAHCLPPPPPTRTRSTSSPTQPASPRDYYQGPGEGTRPRSWLRRA